MNRPLASKLWRAGISVLGVSAVALGSWWALLPKRRPRGPHTNRHHDIDHHEPSGINDVDEFDDVTTTTTIYSKAPLAWPSSGSAAILRAASCR